MTPSKKYLVIAGRISSKYDGDYHKITGPQLCRLYGVDPLECVFADEDRIETIRGLSFEGFIILRPRYDGDYKEYLEDIS